LHKLRESASSFIGGAKRAFRVGKGDKHPPEGKVAKPRGLRVFIHDHDLFRAVDFVCKSTIADFCQTGQTVESP
jgi:hypothetical protein